MANSKRSEPSKRGVLSDDRIGALPESLLCHILSILPTHYAVQTSVLSKTWEHMWTDITSVEFDDEMFNGCGDCKRFEQFVYRVLALLKTPNLQTFSLRCEYVSDPSHVTTWISAALSRDVRELKLYVYIPELFEIPVNLFTCKTLSSLLLYSDYFTTLDVPNSICLPNLKNMQLYGFLLANDETFPKLLSGCPVLEDLWVQRDKLVGIFNFIISSPTLKFLRIDFETDESDSTRHTLQINAPALEYLHLNDDMSSKFVIQNLSSLIKADISLHINKWNNDEGGYGDEVLKLINGLSNVEFLELSNATMKALSYARKHITPDFHSLTKLHGDFSCCWHKVCRIQPDEVPKYLLSHLTSVRFSIGFTKFHGSSDRLMLVKFILNEAKSLKKMAISTVCPETKLNLLQEITMLPRLSKLCEIVVL